jgi:hypothetical protein
MANLRNGFSGHLWNTVYPGKFLRLENSEGSEVHRVHLAETRTKSRGQWGKSNEQP